MWTLTRWSLRRASGAGQVKRAGGWACWASSLAEAGGDAPARQVSQWHTRIRPLEVGLVGAAASLEWCEGSGTKAGLSVCFCFLTVWFWVRKALIRRGKKKLGNGVGKDYKGAWGNFWKLWGMLDLYSTLTVVVGYGCAHVSSLTKLYTLHMYSLLSLIILLKSC